MRKSVVLAFVLAIAVVPAALAGSGVCKSMPCCPSSVAAAGVEMNQPECCTTTTCQEPPAAARDYTTAQTDHQHAPAVMSIAIVPAISVLGDPAARWNVSPPIAPSPLQRRMAILSILLV